MKKQDKELLLKDLCARLPYGVKIKFNDGTNDIYNLDGNIQGKFTESLIQAIEDLELKPYLRPMESMTEEEKEQMRDLWIGADTKTHATRLIDFYNKQHFDYRGLIEKGLALPAPEGMYNF